MTSSFGRWRKALLAACSVCLAFSLTACAAERPKPVSLPPVIEANTLGVGDVFVLIIVGEDKWPTEYTVAPDGTVDVPYIHRIKVIGLEPQQVTDVVRQKLIDGQFLTNPSVSVEIKAYNSKRIVVGGEVKNAGAMPLEPGMTLVRALSQAGGLTSLAKKNGVLLRRTVGGKTRAVVVDYDAITNNQIPDVPLQAGDTIFVPQRAF
jgi:protein involved in polysaccharide export with SLBB domain